MGNTGVAGADDVGAVDFNPAELGVMNLYTNGVPQRYWIPKDDKLDAKLITGQFIGSASVGGNLDLGGGIVGAQDIDEIHKKFGVAVSWKNYNDLAENVSNPVNAESMTFGYGHEFFWQPWTWGFSFNHTSDEAPLEALASTVRPRASLFAPLPATSSNALQLGGLYWLRQNGQGPERNIRFGLVLQDVFNFSGGPYVNLGASVPLLNNAVRVNLDYNDIFGTTAPSLNIGAEWAATKDWRVRVGDANLAHQNGAGDSFTAGGGWLWKRWEADVAFANVPDGGDQQWVATGSYKF
jgi:hypothetical protein